MAEGHRLDWDAFQIHRDAVASKVTYSAESQFPLLAQVCGSSYEPPNGLPACVILRQPSCEACRNRGRSTRTASYWPSTQLIKELWTGMTTTLGQYIRRYTSISAVIDILRRRELPLLDPQTWDDRNDRYFMALYKERKSLGGLYALCAARCSETYHHWRVFTGSADGACIEIRRAPLEAALATIPGVSFGDMDYLRLGEVDDLQPADLDRLPFVKRLGFTAEEEYRIIFETDEPQRSAYSLEFPLAWIGRI